MQRMIAALALLVPLVVLAADKTPSQAYLEYHAALKTGLGEDAIWPYATEAARAEFERKFPGEFRRRAFYMMKTTAPMEVRVRQESIKDDVATLTVLPADSESRMVGTATLRLEHGAWKVERVIWQTQ